MPYKNIIIAVDSSQFSLNAAKYGIVLGATLGATVTLLYVIEEAKAVSNPDAGFGMSDTILVLKQEAEAVLESISKLANGGTVAKMMPSGDPRTDIISTASAIGADLIVMGTHGRTGFRHMIIGSVAEYVVRHSSIPVLVVPTK
jgi:nucleotide-binding universal stress UspA family protein